MYFGVNGVSDVVGMEGHFDKGVADGMVERGQWVEKVDGAEEQKRMATDRMSGAPVETWLDRVNRMTSIGAMPEHRVAEAPPPSVLKTPDRGRVPKPAPATSPTHADFLDRASRLLGEPDLSPKRQSVGMSFATVDMPSEDGDGSVRSLGTAEVFSPRTSYAATHRTSKGGSRAGDNSMLFSREVMSLRSSVDTATTGGDSMRDSMILRGGAEGADWEARDRRGMDKYYGSRLDESFESGRRISKMKGNEGKVKLSRGSRMDQGAWEKLYEEQYSGSSDDDDDSV